MSFGVTIIIITGGIDLGLGAYVALASVIAAKIAKSGNPAGLAILASIAMGLLCGKLNGTIITTFRIPPFIVTLGMTQIARGAALLISNGKPVSILGESYTFFGKGDLLGIPMPIIIVMIMFILSTLYY